MTYKPDKVISLKKKSGGRREIRIPADEKQAWLARHVAPLTLRAMLVDTYGVAHGFTPHRSPATNAAEHIGYAVTVCFDLADFYGHCRPEMVRRECADASDGGLGVLFVQTASGLPYLAQGYCTSPALANISFAQTDRKIMRRVLRLKSSGVRCVYTRYADDLTFSFDDSRFVAKLLRGVPMLCIREGFPVNDSKTRIQYAHQGRRVITGVSVGPSDIAATRKLRRKLRAARHRGNKREAHGMAEWARMAMPDWQTWAMKQLARGRDIETILTARRGE